MEPFEKSGALNYWYCLCSCLSLKLMMKHKISIYIFLLAEENGMCKENTPRHQCYKTCYLSWTE